MTAIATQIIERPVNFTAEEVRATLVNRKSQFRRVAIKDPLLNENYVLRELRESDGRAVFDRTGPLKIRGRERLFPPSFGVPCPYGKPGDRLWVRETLREKPDGWVYAADEQAIEMMADDPRAPAMVSWAHHKDGPVCVSIHMPRWASRLTLEITDVRVERLRSIRASDIVAEGVVTREQAENGAAIGTLWREGWDKLNAKRGYSWVSNPWVWVATFSKNEGIK